MNLERSTNNLSKRLERLDSLANGGKSNHNSVDSSDDEHYLVIGSEPPRFAYYRHYRIKNSRDEHRKQTCEAAYDSITQDELDYSLKRKLRMIPEQRYQHEKANWFFHELSYSDQTVHKNGKLVDIFKESGCGHEDNNREEGVCVPECKYYKKYGRIEDDEVIKEHNELVEYHKRHTDIVNIDVNGESKADYIEFSKMWK